MHLHMVTLQAVATLAGVAVAAGSTNSSTCDYTALASRLSSTSSVILPGAGDEFDATVARWSNLEPPMANIVVVAGTEDDAIKTVQFANECSLPFLASNGVHGSITTLGNMTHGISISLRQLDSVDIAPDGQTAVIGGGIRSRNLTDALWAAGKQTVTGTCECVGYLGPGLGGGHGWLQGQHGLVADQFRAANLVLANGSLVTVDPAAQPDLFWALRGAGHNFGIVTSVTSAIHDVAHPNYALATLFFRGDQVEAVYQLANDLWYPTPANGSSSSSSNMPVDLNNWSYWYFDPTTDPEQPIIAMYLIQEGVDAVDPAHTQPFLDLGPVASEAASGTYLDLARWTGISLGDTPCQVTGAANPRFPIYLRSYNATAQRRAYDLFAQAVTNESTPFSTALFMFEGYAMQGVKAVPAGATAFAHRDHNLLVAPLLTYMPASSGGDDEDSSGGTLDQRAWELGNQLRQVLLEGSSGDDNEGEGSTPPLAAYVNYAYGDETPLAWYGHESWRQERLRALKEEYDPVGKFSFYAPIL